MKVGCVHDWLTSLGGGEKVLQAILEVFSSPLYTLVYDFENFRGSYFEGKEINTSFIQHLPWAKKKYRSYLPLFPIAIEQFDLFEYDLVLSSSHCVAKGVLTQSDQCHICYCHTPMRYAWDLYQQYLRESKLKSGIKGIFAKVFLHHLRMWDVHASARVDAYIANSSYVARRIHKLYGQKAVVIHPPVDVDYFSLGGRKEEFYLTASRFVPYKKIDLIVEAFTRLREKRLVVIGDGPEMKRVKAKAGKNIELLGHQPDEVLREYLQRAKAFVFSALEDFGIVPVEAQACGTPVIAFGKGGVLETVAQNVTGVFFEEQTVESLLKGVAHFEKNQDLFDPKKIRAHAEKFSLQRFQTEFKAFVEKTYREFKEA